MFPLPLPQLSIIGIIQILCIFHAVKTGRTSPWLYILLFLPGIGVLFYFFIEILPDPTAYPFGFQIHELWQKLTHSQPTFTEIEEMAKETPTITNLENLADAYVRQNQISKAIPLYQQALAKQAGTYPDLHRKLAVSLFHLNRFAEAKAELGYLSGTDDYRPDDEVMLARTLTALGERSQALHHFQTAVPQTLHLENYYHYGQLLKENRENEALKKLVKMAKITYNELIPRLQKQEKAWVDKMLSEFK